MAVTADATARIDTTMTRIDERDQDRLELLDRIAERVPELDLERQSVEWTTLDDGHEALIVNGGGFDGGSGAYFANAGEDVHAVGMLDPIVPGHIGCIVIKPDRPQAPGPSSPSSSTRPARADRQRRTDLRQLLNASAPPRVPPRGAHAPVLGSEIASFACQAGYRYPCA
jgi:hypothetical protein